MNKKNRTVQFFDKIEDRVRGHLSRSPIVYSIIGGVAIVLFWRGVWNSADLLETQGGILGFLFFEPINLLIVVIVLLISGLFVSYFIGDTILISGLKKEKKIQEKTEKEVRESEATLGEMNMAVRELKEEVDIIKEIVEQDHFADHSRGDKK